MYWYVVHVKLNHNPKIIQLFNNLDDVSAFIPKIEKWYNVKSIKDYVIKEVYPNYIFLKSPLNKKEFKDKYGTLFKTISGLVDLLDYDDVYVLKQEEQILMEKLFNGEDTIRRSVGNIVNSQLVVESGPLLNLENLVIKIDRHHRIATLQTHLFNKKIQVPLEVVHKS